VPSSSLGHIRMSRPDEEEKTTGEPGENSRKVACPMMKKPRKKSQWVRTEDTVMEDVGDGRLEVSGTPSGDVHHRGHGWIPPPAITAGPISAGCSQRVAHRPADPGSAVTAEPVSGGFFPRGELEKTCSRLRAWNAARAITQPFFTGHGESVSARPLSCSRSAGGHHS